MNKSNPKFPCSVECISYAICNARFKEVNGISALIQCEIFLTYIVEMSKVYSFDRKSRNKEMLKQANIHFNNI